MKFIRSGMSSERGKINPYVSRVTEPLKYSRKRSLFGAKVVNDWLPTNPTFENVLNDSTKNDQNLGLLQCIDIVMEICDTVRELQEINVREHAFFLLTFVLYAFLSILLNSYYLLCLLVAPSMFHVPKHLAAANLSYQLVVPAIKFFLTVTSFGLTTVAGKRLVQTVFKMIYKTKDSLARARLMELAHQTMYNIPDNSVFGMFSFGPSLIITVISSITTYLVILIQFSEDPNAEVKPENANYQVNLTSTDATIIGL